MKKALLNIGLLIVVVILWSRIGIDFGKSISTKETNPSKGANTLGALDLETRDRFVYTSIYRDIFSREGTNSSEIKSQSIQRKPQRPKNRMKLLGVIGDSKQPMAIIDVDGDTKYLSVRDSILSGIVTTIAPDSIIISGKVGDPEILYLNR